MAVFTSVISQVSLWISHGAIHASRSRPISSRSARPAASRPSLLRRHPNATD